LVVEAVVDGTCGYGTEIAWVCEPDGLHLAGTTVHFGCDEAATIDDVTLSDPPPLLGGAALTTSRTPVSYSKTTAQRRGYEGYAEVSTSRSRETSRSTTLRRWTRTPGPFPPPA
jgi:hypothetical protein